MVTKPEQIVRSFFDEHGLQYEIDSELPGRPDILLTELNTAVFVHGCFWHRHGCRRLPRTRLRFWLTRFRENKARDLRVRRELQRLGWTVIEVWECEIGSFATRTRHDQRNPSIRALDKIVRDSKRICAATA